MFLCNFEARFVRSHNWQKNKSTKSVKKHYGIITEYVLISVRMIFAVFLKEKLFSTLVLVTIGFVQHGHNESRHLGCDSKNVRSLQNNSLSTQCLLTVVITIEISLNKAILSREFFVKNIHKYSRLFLSLTLSPLSHSLYLFLCIHDL